ncbi:hypothetical protein E9993_13070 [Labilibacter sediminis]|nr:hypothetical protein E9993_13070 [Labilibacter sediminis]
MLRQCFILFFCCLALTVHAQTKTIDNLQRPKVGLVLSGGGAKGFAYIGLLKVFHEVGLPIDYIGGSSIGAIVGGLYAMGYHPDSIAQMIRNEDWRKVISNKLDRKYIAFEEKMFNEKNLVTFPLENRKLKIASSLYGSLHVDLMLNRYFTQETPIKNFNDLQTPFLCIGTDLLTGEPIVLKDGNLPRAIRSSMAIPGYFSSVNYQNHRFIDGGIVNNYPAKEVRDMGADIIIGGDVQDLGVTNVDELSNILALYNHIIGYNKNKANVVGMENTDLYIRYEMDYGMLDFTQHDSIIALGERVSRLHYDELKNLADSLNSIEYKPIGEFTHQPIDSIYINRIKVKIDEGIYSDDFTEFIEGIESSTISIKKLEEEIKYIYGRRSYGEVYHQFIQNNDKTDLVLHVNEPKNGHLGAGIHYDSDYKANVLVNFTLRNQTPKRAKFFTDLIIGNSPRLRSLFLINNAHKAGLGIEADIFSFNLSEYNNGVRTNKWIFDNLTLGTFIPFEINNNFMVKAGVHYNAFRYKQDLKIDTTFTDDGVINSFADTYISFHRDTRDDIYFPTRGSNTVIKGKYIFPFREKSFGDDVFIASVQSDYNFSLSNKLVFQPGFFVGVTLHDKKPPVQHLFGTGGLNSNNYIENHQPFAGLRFIEKFGAYSLITRAKINYNFLTNLHLTAIADIGANEMELQNFTHSNIMFGGGLKLSYNSFVGPIGLTLSGSNQAKGLISFLNIGYWF